MRKLILHLIDSQDHSISDIKITVWENQKDYDRPERYYERNLVEINSKREL